MKAIENFIVEAINEFGVGSTISEDQVRDTIKKVGRSGFGFGHIKQSKIFQNGKFTLPTDVPKQKIVPNEVVSTTQTSTTTNDAVATAVNLVATNMDKQNLVPQKFEGFVPWGHHNTIKQIVKSGLFYPVFVTGLSGNGKTLMIEQIHAEMKKELIRVNITIETDEDDLLGGFRLVNGETKFVPGPVIEAMERGCTLLLDECDLGSNKLLALQPVLEGKGVYLKKVNKWVTPKEGFNVMATANTKGKGSEDGRFIGTNILNEAFLERFAITIEQPYATSAVEKKIVLGSMKKYGKVDEDFATNLVTWSEVIRKTDHITKAFAIFGDKMKSIELCVARFDEETKESFLDLYTKIDEGVDPLAENTSENDDVLSEDEEEDHAAF